MKNTVKTLMMALAVGLLASTSLFAQFAATGTTTLSVTVGAEAALQINTGTTTLSNGGSTTFANAYTGTTLFDYKVRTTKVGGAGQITLKVTSDFPAGGPSVASPLPGDALTYTCTSTLGTVCAGSQTASTASTTPVIDFGQDAHSATAGTAGSVSWTLPDDPAYQTGNYTATALFTISAT